MISKSHLLHVLITLLITTDKWPPVHSQSNHDFVQLHWQWNKCCISKGSICYDDSCYKVETRPGAWNKVRSRCRSRFSRASDAVDLIQITDKGIPAVLYNLMEKYSVRSIWTSGFTCGKKADFRWASTNASFPWWLSDTLPKPEGSSQGNCRYLVVTIDPQSKIASYKFMDQHENFPAICEFTLVNRRTKTTEETTESSSKMTESAESSSRMTQSTLSTIESASIGPAGRTEVTTEETSSTIITKNPTTNWTITDIPTMESSPDSSTARTNYRPTIETTKSTDQRSSTHRQETKDDKDTDKQSDVCRRREAAGISWPDTEPGNVARRSCPEGMIGEAEWVCDAETLEFQPERPRLQNCRHEWIVDLEREVELEVRDAVELSQRLAIQTTKTSLAFGDLPALVNLTGKLLSLYAKQSKGVITSTMQRDRPSYRFTKSLVASYNHVLRKDVFQAWAYLEQEQQLKEASRIIRQMQWSGHHLSCSVVSSKDLQYSLMEENIKMQTFNLDYSESLVFPALEGANSSLRLPTDLRLKRPLPSVCPKESHTAVGILYKNLGRFLQTREEEKATSLVHSPVISFSLSNSTQTVPLPKGTFVSLVLEKLDEDLQLGGKLKCVFWNFNRGKYGEWDTTGCYITGNNKTHAKCSCDHLTNFALILDVNGMIQPDEDVLRQMTLVCCTVSTFALLATCLALLGIKAMRCRRSTITCNLSFCLLLMNLLILFGFDQTRYQVVCAVVAGLFHFIILASFCWMILEGLHLYQMVVLVFYYSSRLPMAYFYIFGYGVPLAIVAISASIRPGDYGTEKVCWLSNENGLMWSVVGTVAVMCLINLVIFVKTMLSASSAKVKKEQRTTKKVKAWLKGSFSILCLLGLTWSLGFLSVFKDLAFVSYVFTALNGLQGVFIFIFHVLLNEKATSALMKGFNTKYKSHGIQRKGRAFTLSSNQQTSTSKKSLTGSDTSLPRSADGSNGSPTNCKEPVAYQTPQRASLYIRNAASTAPTRPVATRGRSY